MVITINWLFSYKPLAESNPVLRQCLKYLGITYSTLAHSHVCSANLTPKKLKIL